MLVSIGLPVRNGERTLGLTVTSVLMQTFADFELIVVDDASEDGTRSVLEIFRDRRITVITDHVRRGLAYRLNQIADLARGQYLARMDADDVMHPDRIRRQLQFLTAHPEIDVLGTDAYVIDSRDRLVKYCRAPDDCSPRSVIFRGFFIHPTIMGKRRWFVENPYDVGFYRAEDYELWVRTCRRSKFANLHEPLLFYRSDHTVRFTKYLASQATRADVIAQYGPQVVGVWGTRMAIAKILLHACASTVARASGLAALVNWVRGRRDWVWGSERKRRAEAERVLRQVLRNYQTLCIDSGLWIEPAEQGYRLRTLRGG
jgi:glycosyltransferase involved in cell wall biosynthesis